MPLDSIAVFSVLDRVTNSDGTPVSEGTVEFYLAGTSTPLTVYSDYGLTTSLGTTVSLNSAGYPVSGGGSVVSVYTGTSAYKIIVKDADGATIADLSRDNIKGAVEIPVTDELALPETPVVTKTSAYSIVDADQGKVINANCTGGSFVLTLPSAVTVGDGWRAAGRHVGTANVATIRTTSSQTIDIAGKQVTSFSLKGRGQSIWLVSDGANWHVDGSTPAFMQDGLPYFKVTDRLTAPPTSPTGGARYIANGTPTGAWSTLSFSENQIIEADGNGSWFAYTPDDGYLAYVEDEALYSYWNGSAWTDMTNVTAPTTSALKVAIWSDEKSTNTSGGTSADDAWTTHTLQTERTNTITGASLSGSQFTLPTGKYRIDCQMSAYAMSETQIRLYSITNSTAKGASVQVYTANYVSNSASILSGAPIVLTAYVDVTAATEVFALQYYTTVGGVASSLGHVRNIGSETEVYAIVSVLDLTSIQGPTGEQGTQGTDGLDAAYPYQWSTSTSGDPGSGKIRGNNATIASITEIAVSETDSAGGTMSGVIDTWDSGTSSVKARIKISKEGATQNFHYFYITGAGTDQGSYWTFPVSYTATSGTIANNDNCAVLVLEKGDKGDTGTAGSQGDPGIPGSTGATGPNTGLDFAWSTATSGDPGSGKVLANNATLTSATAINISKTGRNSESLGAVIATWDDSTNTAHYGHLRIFTVADRTEYIEAEVTGLTDNSTYYTVAVTVTAAAGTPSANDVMAVMFERTGNKGNDGAGVGDVVGPASATTDRVAAFDGTTGKLLKDGGKTIAEIEASAAASAVSTVRSGVDAAFDTLAEIKTSLDGKEPTDPLLTAIATLSMVADRLIYGTGTDTVSLATLTAAGRALLDDADAAAQRTTLGVGTGDSPQFTAINVGHASNTTVSQHSAGVIQVEDVPLYSQIPQNSQSAAYTLVLADAQKHIYHPGSDNNARTFTIPANSSVAYPIGTCLTFVNAINTVTIAITSDTLTLAGSGSTGSRTLAANGMATALKVASTSWMISGTNLT